MISLTLDERLLFERKSRDFLIEMPYPFVSADGTSNLQRE